MRCTPSPLSSDDRESLMLQAPHLRPTTLQRSGSGGFAAGVAPCLSPSPASLGGHNAQVVAQLLKAGHSLQKPLRTPEGSSHPAERLAAAAAAMLAGGGMGGGDGMPAGLRMHQLQLLLQHQQQASPAAPTTATASQRADLRPAKRVLQRSAVSCLSDGGSRGSHSYLNYGFWISDPIPDAMRRLLRLLPASPCCL